MSGNNGTLEETKTANLEAIVTATGSKEQSAKQKALAALDNDEEWSWAQWRAVAVGMEKVFFSY